MAEQYIKRWRCLDRPGHSVFCEDDAENEMKLIDYVISTNEDKEQRSEDEMMARRYRCSLNIGTWTLDANKE